ncbi:TetR/AcrR family transcriptional regulator [Rhodococcus sp. SJ-3]|uniref:TetR/AcrR family transcriptional regulator n=1 Tax=Rhodococcus sp. SJ-3 TaxID=3454628 RepID=UPI003F7A2CB8
MPTAARAPRADAQRNRAKLLAAAAPLAGTGGGELSLEQVARDAGVSIATLYRHFPTRESLLLAISHQDAIDHSARASDLLATAPPVEALRQWLSEMGRYGLTRPGMGRAFRVSATEPVSDEVYRTTADALASLLAAGHGEGAIRADLSADDILLALCGLWDLEDSPEARAQCDRLTGLLYDGLRRSS